MNTQKTKPIVNRAALRRLISEKCAEWQIKRKRVPSALISTIEGDVETVVTRLVVSHLNSATPPPENPPVKRVNRQLAA